MKKIPLKQSQKTLLNFFNKKPTTAGNITKITENAELHSDNGVEAENEKKIIVIDEPLLNNKHSRDDLNVNGVSPTNVSDAKALDCNQINGIISGIDEIDDCIGLTPRNDDKKRKRSPDKYKKIDKKSNTEDLASGQLDLINDCIVISPQKIDIKKGNAQIETTSESLNIKKSLFSSSLSNGSCSILNHFSTKTFDDKDDLAYFAEISLEDTHGNLDLSNLKRYKVIEVENLPNNDVKLSLKNLSENQQGTCILKSPWTDCRLREGDTVSAKGRRSPDNGWVVDWTGLLVTNPDMLLSGTTIVSSVYCTRKTVLSHFFREASSAKGSMMIGCLTHELFQEVLKKKLNSLEDIEEEYEKMVSSKEFMITLFNSNLDLEETKAQLYTFLPHIHKFVYDYTLKKDLQQTVNRSKTENWSGEILSVEDIEENIWSPVLGIKGKIDATLRVRADKKTRVLPLELKTGKVSFSIEHRGQVILYCMLLQQLGHQIDSGLLLYLNNGVNLKEIRCEERETRDLTLLRNGLCSRLSNSASVVPETSMRPPPLPPPINRSSCSSCPFLVPCAAALREDGMENISEKNHLRQLTPKMTEHLSDSHIKFVFHYLGLLILEKNNEPSTLSEIWTTTPEKREEMGKCLTNMIIDDCTKEDTSGFVVTLSKKDRSLLETDLDSGQLVVVSSAGHVAQAIGIIKEITPITVSLRLDKLLKTNDPLYIDWYESSNSIHTNLMNNLSLLLENSGKGALLRELIIDRKVPTFSAKLSSKIRKIGEDIFGRLNKEQVRAVLQVIAADNFLLIKGVPGAGKTTTLVALVELLSRLGQRVLVTAWTHSAVDNILRGLLGRVTVLRLGSSHRIHPDLLPHSEASLLASATLTSPDQIDTLFKSKRVVGATCLGSSHPWLERQQFEVCLVDEASQVTLPGLLRSISLANKFVLVGDPKQLPPLVKHSKARELGLGESLFERLERPAVTSPLSLQYRMNQPITDLANHLTYSGLLKCASQEVATARLQLNKEAVDDSPDWVRAVLSDELDKSVIVLNVNNSSSGSHPTCDQIENKAEGQAILILVKTLVQGGITNERIGIMATYTKQVNYLRSILMDQYKVEVNTIDQYQGRDKHVVLFSTSRTKASSGKDILSDWNRLNVAITRSKVKLIILGNLEILKSYSNFSKLLTWIPESNIVVPNLSQDT